MSELLIVDGRQLLRLENWCRQALKSEESDAWDKIQADVTLSLIIYWRSKEVTR